MAYIKLNNNSTKLQQYCKFFYTTSKTKNFSKYNDSRTYLNSNSGFFTGRQVEDGNPRVFVTKIKFTLPTSANSIKLQLNKCKYEASESTVYVKHSTENYSETTLYDGLGFSYSRGEIKNPDSYDGTITVPFQGATNIRPQCSLLKIDKEFNSGDNYLYLYNANHFSQLCGGTGYNSVNNTNDLQAYFSYQSSSSGEEGGEEGGSSDETDIPSYSGGDKNSKIIANQYDFDHLRESVAYLIQKRSYESTGNDTSSFKDYSNTYKDTISNSLESKEDHFNKITNTSSGGFFAGAANIIYDLIKNNYMKEPTSTTEETAWETIAAQDEPKQNSIIPVLSDYFTIVNYWNDGTESSHRCNGACTGFCSGGCVKESQNSAEANPTKISKTYGDGFCNQTCTSTCGTSCETACYSACKHSCAGTCSGGCEGTCGGGCSGSCGGCSEACKAEVMSGNSTGSISESGNTCQDCTANCSAGCAGGCNKGCDGCTNECTNECGKACIGSCRADCWNVCNTVCSSKCASSCSGKCSTTCGNSCGGCGSSCGNYCTGSCGNSCEGTCSTTCGSNCTGGCGEECTGGCASACKGTCTFSCSGTCKGTTTSS